MNKDLNQCPNCNTPLKSGLMSSNKLLEQDKTNIINEYLDEKSSEFCNKCGDDLFVESNTKMQSEIIGISNLLSGLISNVPVISTHSPLNWHYSILDMVTGQSTTGTGVITEFTSSFTDLFGAQSGRHNQKSKRGEEICFAQLRKKTLDLGGNAVIATDIDYSEVGSGRGMLMVCMAGTAISLKHVEILGEEKSNKILQLQELNQRLKYLNKFQLTEF